MKITEIIMPISLAVVGTVIFVMILTRLISYWESEEQCFNSYVYQKYASKNYWVKTDIRCETNDNIIKNEIL